MKIVVIIPTYNEAENIGRMLDVLVKEELPKVTNNKVEILVVDSKSPDGTAIIIKDKMKKYREVNLLETNKGGLGADYVKGMGYAMEKLKADAVMEFDADFQHDPKDIKRLIAAMDKGADHVIGSRYIPGGAIPKEWGIHRKIISLFGSLFARLVLFMFGVHDMTSGFKLTKTEYLKRVDLKNLYSKYYAYKIQITYELAKLGAGIIEVPIIFYERREGTSKISRKDFIDSFMVVVKLRIRDSKRFIKFGIVGVTGFTINAIALEVFARMPFTTVLADWFSSWNTTAALNFFQQPSAWAAASAAELAIISNFLFNNYWTFAGKSINDPRRFLWKFSHFNLTSFGAIVIQAVVIGVATLLFGNNTLVRQLALVIAVGVFIVPYNYTMYNVFIWKTWKVPGLGWLQNRKA